MISSAHASEGRLRRALRTSWEVSPSLSIVCALMALGAAAASALIFLDDRVILGAAAWMKPTKFFVSFVIYCGTFLWMGSLFERRALIRRVADVTAFVTVIEMVIIAGQVTRGTRSHFNTDTIFDSVVGGIMGSAILLLWVSTLVMALGLRRERLTNEVLATGLRWGVIATLLGMLSGFLMFAGGRASFGHTVGAPDGGRGLPILNWSTTHGDWRPGHFMGLHGLQVLPLLALWLARRPDFSVAQKLTMVRAGAVLYIGSMACLLIQAARGQSIVAPDGLTLLTFAAVAATSLVITGFAVLRGRQGAPAIYVNDPSPAALSYQPHERA